jgi:hypothetical protein
MQTHCLSNQALEELLTPLLACVLIAVPISSASSSPSKRARSLSRDIDQSGDQVGSPGQQLEEQEQEQEQDLPPLPPLLAAFQPSPHLMQQVRQLRKEAPDAIMEALCTLTKSDTNLARDDQALLQSEWHPCPCRA